MIQRHIAEDLNLRKYRCENLKSRMEQNYFEIVIHYFQHTDVKRMIFCSVRCYKLKLPTHVFNVSHIEYAL
jgi:hypothetical protein